MTPSPESIPFKTRERQPYQQYKSAQISADGRIVVVTAAFSRVSFSFGAFGTTALVDSTPADARLLAAELIAAADALEAVEVAA